MKLLTAYFSHSGENYFSGKIIAVEKGNTAIVADKIAAMTGCDLFEIKREVDYPFGYRDCVKESRYEMASGTRPKLREYKDVSGYDTMIVAYPNWCGTMPMPVFSFLESADFAGKKILSLCTNEGSGLAKSVSDIKKLCPKAEVAEGLSVKGGNANECDDDVRGWLYNNGII